jgi:hypothetical protein
MGIFRQNLVKKMERRPPVRVNPATSDWQDLVGKPGCSADWTMPKGNSMIDKLFDDTIEPTV